MSFVMRGAAVVCALSLAACSGGTASTSATAAASARPSAPLVGPVGPITIVGDEPVLHASDLGEYGADLPGAYFEADGLRHAYVVGFGAEPGSQKIYHLTSSDGIDWTLDREDPFADLGLDLSPPGPIPGSVIQADDGGWVMYLWGVPSPFTFGSVIWRATASAPGGPWVADPEPVLPRGEPGSWDDQGIDFPAVVRADTGYLMLYGGVGAADREASRIGLATSADGIAWTKAPEPVVQPNICGDASAKIATLPRLIPVDGGYLLLFDRGRETGVATSPDGRTWTCASTEPILTAADLPDSGGIHTFAATRIGSEVSVPVESLIGESGGSELWLGRIDLEQ